MASFSVFPPLAGSSSSLALSSLSAATPSSRGSLQQPVVSSASESSVSSAVCVPSSWPSLSSLSLSLSSLSTLSLSPSFSPSRPHRPHRPPRSLQSAPFILVLIVSTILSSCCLPLAAASPSVLPAPQPPACALALVVTPHLHTPTQEHSLAIPLAIPLAVSGPSLLPSDPPSEPPIATSGPNHIALQKRQAPNPAATSASPPPKGSKPRTPSSTPTPTNGNGNGGSVKSVMSTPSSTAPASTLTPTPPAVNAKGDFALFGHPSVVGAYNLTSGILIYSAFMLLFVAAVGAATWQRAQYRNQFRQQQRNNMESGRVTPGDKGSSKRGGASASRDNELSDAALFKQASISKRALMKDVGPGGVMAANEAVKTKIAAANGAGRSFEDRELDHQQGGLGVRFGESNGASHPGTGRTGGMKKSTRADHHHHQGTGGSYEMDTYGQQVQDPSYYHDNQDMTDYSRPPLQESTDPYYSSGSSHSGYLDQVEDYHYNAAGSNSPQVPKPSYQQHHPGQASVSSAASSSPQPPYQQPIFVQRTNSSRMPKNDLHDGNNILRSNSGRRTNGTTTPTRGLEHTNGSGSNYNSNGSQQPPSRIATPGHVDRSGSGGNSRANSPIDGGMGMHRAGSNASSSRTRIGGASPTMMHPTPIARSNSTRLPPSMRVGTPQPPSSLSQQTNTYDYM
ncbi:hypothetical protein EC968_007686 [Mortierella alpina]|nr:hypothetical protein EC968_007686 [Mortierella alpina]